MASVNKVILVGHLGADPESRSMPNGDAVCNIRIATTESWKDKASGEKKEITEWHRIVFYRQLADIAGKYLKKGAAVYVEGRIRTRKWQDKDGQDKYSTEIEATSMQMLGSGRQGGQDGGESGGGQPASSAPAPRQSAAGGGQPAAYDDDIPF